MFGIVQTSDALLFFFFANNKNKNIMIDNATLTIKAGEKTVKYRGVICNSIAEASSLLHPSYWEDIHVGYKMEFENGTKILFRYAKNIMLIRVNGSRNFVQITK